MRCAGVLANLDSEGTHMHITNAKPPASQPASPLLDVTYHICYINITYTIFVLVLAYKTQTAGVCGRRCTGLRWWWLFLQCEERKHNRQHIGIQRQHSRCMCNVCRISNGVGRTTVWDVEGAAAWGFRVISKNSVKDIILLFTRVETGH